MGLDEQIYSEAARAQYRQAYIAYFWLGPIGLLCIGLNVLFIELHVTPLAITVIVLTSILFLIATIRACYKINRSYALLRADKRAWEIEQAMARKYRPGFTP